MRSTPRPRLPLIVLTLGALTCASACGGGSQQAYPPLPPVEGAAGSSTPASTPGNAAPILPASASSVTIDRMAAYPTPGWNIPRAVSFSPDGKLVTFLQSKDGKGGPEMALFSMRADSGKTELLVRAEDVVKEDRPLSREEELRRERQRKRIEGVTQFAWAKKKNVMVIPLGGDVFVRLEDGSMKRLTDTEAAEIDPQICPSGERVAFVRGGELFAIDVASGTERQLTRGAPDGVTRGLTDFNGQEEFGEPHGFFWSPDCQQLAYLEVDERKVGEIPILGYRGEADFMEQRFPRAGTTNPDVRLGVVRASGGGTSWMSLPEDTGYVVRIAWTPDGKRLVLQHIDRAQHRRDLHAFDVGSGRSKVLTSTSSKAWVEASDIQFSPSGDALFWLNESEGFDHVERIALDGSSKQWVTTGAFTVHGLHGFSESGDVIISANADHPIEQRIYAAKAAPDGAPEKPRPLTTDPGWHDVTISPDGKFMVDVHSAIDREPRADVRPLTGGAVTGSLPTVRDPDMDQLALRTPSWVEATAADGAALHGALLAPRHVEPGKSYPLIVMVYGGPGVQIVKNRWDARLLWQHLADRGFYVMQLDNRGSAGRGPAFAHPLSEKMGTVELDDQLAGLEAVLKSHPIDPKRVGIYGHSYGGFMAALAMLKAPEHFAVGVAGSPVTRWDLYDTGYTERYMGTPQSNERGYAQSDLGTLAGGLVGELFIIHALMDENVHFEHTAHLVNALVEAGKDFDLLVFPGERHGYRSPAARRYAHQRVISYLVEHLAGTPAVD